jgi:hypothetical protein
MYNMFVKVDKESLTLFGYAIRYEILILIGVLYLIIFGHTMCSCTKLDLTEEFSTLSYFLGNKNWWKQNTPMEGFVGANTNYGESSKFSVDGNKPVDTSSWFTPNLVITPGEKPSAGAQAILDRKSQPVPLPPGELLMFANTPFKPECCPNTYSNSMGCACMTDQQYNYLVTRGSNNVPYSEY